MRRTMNLPMDPTCAAPESQAKIADAKNGIKDAADINNCNLAQSAVPLNLSNKCERDQSSPDSKR